jgi:hypothetical protein
LPVTAHSFGRIDERYLSHWLIVIAEEDFETDPFGNSITSDQPIGGLPFPFSGFPDSSSNMQVLFSSNLNSVNPQQPFGGDADVLIDSPTDRTFGPSGFPPNPEYRGNVNPVTGTPELPDNSAFSSNILNT